MRLGDKPLAEMTLEEMREAIATLRGERDALRSEAIRRKEARETAPPKQRKPKEPTEADRLAQEVLAMLRGGAQE